MTRQEGTGAAPGEFPGVVLSEERIAVHPQWQDTSTVRAHRFVETGIAAAVLPLAFDELESQRVPAAKGDSGKVETLEDGSISIPLLEERVVVTRQTVVRERVILRKRQRVEQRTISETVRRERLEVDGIEGLEPGNSEPAQANSRRS